MYLCYSFFGFKPSELWSCGKLYSQQASYQLTLEYFCVWERFTRINSLKSELKGKEKWTKGFHFCALTINIFDLADFKWSQIHPHIRKGTQVGKSLFIQIHDLDEEWCILRLFSKTKLLKPGTILLLILGMSASSVYILLFSLSKLTHHKRKTGSAVQCAVFL